VSQAACADFDKKNGTTFWFTIVAFSAWKRPCCRYALMVVSPASTSWKVEASGEREMDSSR